MLFFCATLAAVPWRPWGLKAFSSIYPLKLSAPSAGPSPRPVRFKTFLKTLPRFTPLHHRGRNRRHPVVHQTVTFQTLRRKSLRHMVRIPRLLEIIHVAARALGRQSLPVERAHRSHLVAGIAIHHRVRPNQREAILVLVDVVDRDLPPCIAMAQVALRAVLAPMNIRVAVLALVASLREHQVGVTIRAADLRMQPAQRESRLTMIELGHRPDRLPALRSVAVLARDAQLAMGTVRLVCRTRARILARKHPQM